MSEPAKEKPKRRFWQIHLSTAVILMFVVGGMLWMNSIRRFTPNLWNWPDGGVIFGWIERGWPFAVYRQDALLTDFESFNDEESFFEKNIATNDFGERELLVPGKGVAYSRRGSKQGVLVLNAFLNGAIAVGLFFGIVIGFEWLIRRRGGRKQ